MRLAAAVLLAALAAGCGDDDDRLRVLAAASLQNVLPVVEPDAEYAFGGSNQLVTQLLEGVEADLVATVGAEPMARLERAGLVDEPVAFASNRLVVVVPRADRSISELSDLAREGVRLVLGDEGVPAGDYAREALAAAGLDAALRRVVSLEDDVRGVLAKVALGEADAGIVYATDVAAAGDDVRAIAIPDRLQPLIAYVVAAVGDGDRAGARVFIERLTGAMGRDALTGEGFGLP